MSMIIGTAMSRKHQDLEGAGGSGGDANCKPVWDTGSSLYDSYELAALRRLLLDKRLLAAAAAGGALPLRDDDEPPAAGDQTRGKSRRQVVPVPVRVRRKVTLRALFRAVATWVPRPSQAPPLACACAGIVHDQSAAASAAAAAVEQDLPSHGQL